MTYKCLNGLGPSNSAENFVNALIYTITLLASAIRFQYPFFETTSSQRAFTFRATSIWNSLDDNIKDSSSLRKFKASMKEYLLTQYNL